MEFKIEKELESGMILFSGRVSPSDLCNLRLDHIERQVLGSPALTAADQLQSLEIIFRRAQEQNQAAKTPQPDQP